jgi:integrase
MRHAQHTIYYDVIELHACMLPHVAYGTRERWGQVGEQLRLPLAWAPAASDLGASIGTVLAAWTDKTVVSAATLARFTGILSRFGRYAAARDIATLGAVDPALVEGFVAARHRGRSETITAPTVTTMCARRAALRAFFGTARQLRLTLDDPTTGIVTTARDGSPTGGRPLTDEEAALVRVYSQRATPTRHAAAVALLLAGAHTGEAGHVTTADLDLTAGVVTVHASSRYRARTLPLDGWARRVLAERAAHLIRDRHTGNPVVLCAAAAGSPASRQASVCATVRAILTRAGLCAQPGVRPSSLTGYAGRRVFEQTGHVEDAARLLGSSSLDTAAVLIGHPWQPRQAG